MPCAVVTTLVAHRADVAALACMAPLGLLATGSADTNIKLWDLLPGGCDAGRSAASNRGSSGGSGGSTHQTIREARQVLKGHSAPLTQLRFTPDGELLISGDAAGGLQVWHVAGGAAGRLLHDLSGTHTAAITGIACHPEERLFATCSLDRTLRVWDLDGAQAGRCIGVHGPEGRREARALAFAGARAGGADGSGSGAVLLAAYADGLRTFSPDPLQHHDTADLPWSKVRDGWVGRQGVRGLAA
jgi:katanin p80 WD40 repeat-containing subunit B1